MGISHKVFTKNRYYDFGKSSLEPYFSKFENFYVKLIDGFESRSSIGEVAKVTMINWMHMSKTRGDFFRHMATSVFKSKDEERGEFAGKLFQLMTFYGPDFESSKLAYATHFLKNEWIILIASDDHHFITNDNPGLAYSDYYKIKLLNMSPVFGDFNFTKEYNAIHFFPLTFKMCLCLKPQEWKDDMTSEEMESKMLADIKFQTADHELVQNINNAVYFTRHKMIVANREGDVGFFLKKNNDPPNL